jgi:DNA repair protein RecN (Recombination protein N)
MGDIIKELSGMTQIINITHLPQVAAKGNNHYLVYKEDVANGTYTRVRKLDDSERVTEIAKMLSGAKITESALKHARELLQ